MRFRKTDSGSVTIFHRPFTVILFVIVFLHVGVVTFLGYGLRWW